MEKEITVKKVAEKATLKDFLAQKIRKQENKNATIDAYVTSMGRTITLKKPSEDRILDYANEIGGQIDIKIVIEENRKIIYDSCEELQDVELHKALEIVDPYDVPKVLFEVNDVKEIMNQFNELIGGKSAAEEVDEKIKNS